MKGDGGEIDAGSSSDDGAVDLNKLVPFYVVVLAVLMTIGPPVTASVCAGRVVAR